MSDPSNQDFMKSFGGGAAANLIFVGLYMLYKLFNEKCKHSKCKSHTACCEISAQEDSDSSKDDEIQNLRRDVDEKISQFIGGLTQSVRQSRKSIVRNIESRQSPAPGNSLVEKQNAQNQVWEIASGKTAASVPRGTQNFSDLRRAG